MDTKEIESLGWSVLRAFVWVLISQVKKKYRSLWIYWSCLGNWLDVMIFWRILCGKAIVWICCFCWICWPGVCLPDFLCWMIPWLQQYLVTFPLDEVIQLPRKETFGMALAWILMLETVSQYSPSTDLVNFLQGKTNMKIGMLSVIVLVLQHFFHFVKPRGALYSFVPTTWKM